MSRTKIVFECPSFTVEPQEDGSAAIRCPFFRFDSTHEDGGHVQIHLEGLRMSFKSSKSGEASDASRPLLSGLGVQLGPVLKAAMATQQWNGVDLPLNGLDVETAGKLAQLLVQEGPSISGSCSDASDASDEDRDRGYRGPGPDIPF